MYIAFLELTHIYLYSLFSFPENKKQHLKVITCIHCIVVFFLNEVFIIKYTHKKQQHNTQPSCTNGRLKMPQLTLILKKTK